MKKDGGGKGRREKGREEGREELRSWMAAKRRERLTQFLAERDRLRKREKHPFQPPPGVSAEQTLGLAVHVHVHVHACYIECTACILVATYTIAIKCL